MKKKSIAIEIIPCISDEDEEEEATLSDTSSECPSQKEIEKYFSDKVLLILEVKNFIDYNKVDDKPV